jgi:hypothetical protein
MTLTYKSTCTLKDTRNDTKARYKTQSVRLKPTLKGQTSHIQYQQRVYGYEAKCISFRRFSDANSCVSGYVILFLDHVQSVHLLYCGRRVCARSVLSCRSKGVCTGIAAFRNAECQEHVTEYVNWHNLKLPSILYKYV